MTKLLDKKNIDLLFSRNWSSRVATSIIKLAKDNHTINLSKKYLRNNRAHCLHHTISWMLFSIRSQCLICRQWKETLWFSGVNFSLTNISIFDRPKKNLLMLLSFFLLNRAFFAYSWLINLTVAFLEWFLILPIQ